MEESKQAKIKIRLNLIEDSGYGSIIIENSLTYVAIVVANSARVIID